MDDAPRGPEGSAKVVAAAMATFIAAFIAWSEALPALAPEVEGVPLLAGMVVASAGVAAVGWLAGSGRYRDWRTGSAALVVALVVGGWAVVGSRTDEEPGRALPPDETSSATTEPRSPTTTAATAGSPTTATTAPPTPTGTCPALATPGTIHLGVGADQTHVSEVSYTLGEDKDPYIEIVGQLVGTLEPGYDLFVGKTGNPATSDNTSAHKRGSVTFFPRGPLALGPGGCWQTQSWQIGYPCVGGVEVWYHFLLVPEATGAALVAERDAHPGGYPPERIQQDPAIRQLGRIEVPTLPHPDCPD